MKQRNQDPDLRRRVYQVISEAEGQKKLLAEKYAWIKPFVETADINTAIRDKDPIEIWNAMRWLRARGLIVEDNGWKVRPLPKNGICWKHGQELSYYGTTTCPACKW